MQILALILSLMLMPIMASAEVYKWREPNGVMRYSDVPPPSNIKLESLQGRPAVGLTNLPPLAPVEGDITSELKRAKAQPNKQKIAEKADALSAEELQLKQKNCKAAQANLATYQLGGRIATVNEKGERVILSSTEIAQAKIEAQADVKQYCE
ncbi:MAG: DUF4124 domain-containing protein [Candidatus Methylopumilus sp.]|nr:DUF4124 domain-containing protein [Candidatus Methylopumilus sp.]